MRVCAFVDGVCMCVCVGGGAMVAYARVSLPAQPPFLTSLAILVFSTAVNWACAASCSANLSRSWYVVSCRAAHTHRGGGRHTGAGLAAQKP